MLTIGIALYVLLAVGAYWHFGVAETVRVDPSKYVLLGAALVCLMWPIGAYVFYVEPRLKKPEL